MEERNSEAILASQWRQGVGVVGRTLIPSTPMVGGRAPMGREGPQKEGREPRGGSQKQGALEGGCQLARAWGKLPRKYTESCSATIQLDRSGVVGGQDSITLCAVGPYLP